MLRVALSKNRHRQASARADAPASRDNPMRQPRASFQYGAPGGPGRWLSIHHRKQITMPITHAATGTDPKISLAYPDGSLIVRSREIPWTPWGMPGTQFKLLHCDDASSLLVILLKVEPGTVAGVHKHFGAAHAYILEGGFGYEHGEVFAGDYMVEAGGNTHQPFTGPKGLL
jgi:hypothetical protein